MKWEQRLREMILAGGALVAAACSGNGASGGAQEAGASGGAQETPDANGPTQCITNSAPDTCSSDPSLCEQAMGEPEAEPLPVPDAASLDAEMSDDAGQSDAALESSRATSLQCGAGTINGAETDPCTNAGGVCVQGPDPRCCDLVPGFDPVNSGCPHAAFAIRCCVLDGGAGKDVADASTE